METIKTGSISNTEKDITMLDVLKWIRREAGIGSIMDCKDGLMKLIEALKHNPNKHSYVEQFIIHDDKVECGGYIKPYELVIKYEKVSNDKK